MIHVLENKIIELKNRGCRRNACTRGFPELCGEKEAEAFLYNRLAGIFPNLPAQEYTVSAALSLEMGYLRVTLERASLPRQKMTLLLCPRGERISFLGQHKITAYQDLASETLHKKAIMRPVTETLMKPEIQYIWGFPFHFKMRWNGSTNCIQSDRWASFPKAIEFDPSREGRMERGRR